MAVTLGKRKRMNEATKRAPESMPKAAPNPAKADDDDDDDDDDDLRAIFQRAFEARFKPIDGAVAKKEEKEREEKKEKEKQVEEEEEEEQEQEQEQEQDESHQDDESEESDFGGLSEAEAQVEVVDHSDVRQRQVLDKKQIKAFMSAKPPSFDPATPSGATKGKQQQQQQQQQQARTSQDDDGTDASNLQHDLALQRLLNESHLLDSSFSSTDPSGKNRHKATDLRLLSLGSKASVLEQKNMPLSHRKGINAKKQNKEMARRRDAKENGIILERAASKKAAATTTTTAERARGVGAPSVGKFAGGTLRLSKQDIAGITGPRTSSARPTKRGKR